MSERGPPTTELLLETSLSSGNYDGIVVVSSPVIQPKPFESIIAAALALDPVLEAEVAVLPAPDLPAKRIIHAPTGKIDPDYHDVRVYRDAAARGMKRALSAGVKKPLLVVEEDPEFENSELVTLLGALQALYVPIQVREFDSKKKNPVQHLGFFSHNPAKGKKIIETALILESGRRVACDIGDGDPERMAPPKVEEYIYGVFEKSNIKLKEAKIVIYEPSAGTQFSRVNAGFKHKRRRSECFICVNAGKLFLQETIKDPQILAKEYPLFAAVNRAASRTERHLGRIVFLEYTPPNPAKVKETFFFVGKGVTYDTGGIDVKINGAMVGMSRDKCGAAAVVGFMQVVNLLQPPDVKVVVAVPLVRNSIGSEGYVSDEVIVARSGARVRIGNTDAEGRMILADVLCKLKEAALDAVNPHLFTVATLTGHAFLTVGEGYSVVMDNGPAHKSGHSGRLQRSGDAIGDVFEVSRIRQDDFKMHRGEAVGDDVKQANSQPSSRTPRGHQGPAAFLILAAGLDRHGSGNDEPLKYTHVDIAASAGEFPKPATGAPVLAFAQAYLL